MEKVTTLGIDKVKGVKESKDVSIYYKLVKELEANSNCHFKPEIKEEHRMMMFRDEPEWKFYDNDEIMGPYPYYFMMKARYILKNLKRDNAKYLRSIEMKKYFGVYPDEFKFIKRNLAFLHMCTQKIDLKKYKLLLAELYLNRISMRKFVEKYKDQGWTLKKLQNAKTELFTTYIQCLMDNSYKMELADMTIEAIKGNPYEEDPNDPDVMKRRIVEALQELPTYHFESFEEDKKGS